MAKTLAKSLTELPILRGLNDAEAGAVAEISEELSVPQGDFLFKEGDVGDGLFVILAGSLEVLKSDRAGHEQVLAKVSDGSVLGEMSLITGNAARSASARALTDVRLLKIGSTRFTTLLGKDHTGALKIVHNIAQVMSRRLLLMDEKLVDLLDKGKKKEELAAFQKILTNWSF